MSDGVKILLYAVLCWIAVILVISLTANFIGNGFAFRFG